MTEQTILNLADQYLETFATDPARADKDITAALLEIAGGDNEVYLNLTRQAAITLQEKFEVANSATAHEDLVCSTCDMPEAVEEMQWVSLDAE